MQFILLKIHKYKINIIYKPGQGPYFADGLLRETHKENRDEKEAGILVTVNVIDVTTDMPSCTII